MAEAMEHLLVYPLEPMESGVPFTDWVQHITLMPWFITDNKVQLRSELHKLAHLQPPFTVVVGDDALFGPEEDVPVQLIQPSEVIMSFHRQVLDAVNNNAHIINKDIVGDNYRPHITEQRDRRFTKNAELTIGEFVLVAGSSKVTKEPREKRLIARFDLGGL